MPGLVQVAVSTELFKEAGGDRGGWGQQALPLGQLLDCPSFNAPLLSPFSQGARIQ